jgi:hypothetical protein
VQTKDDGKHDILPVAKRSDHAGLPVMMPRDSDGKLRRDGSETVQPVRPDSMKRPVDERGRLHGAPELDPKAEQRIAAKLRVEFTNAKEKRRCRKRLPIATRLRRQDKSRKVRGGRMGKKSNNNNVRRKGAHVRKTLLHMTNRWKDCEQDKVQVTTP